MRALVTGFAPFGGASLNASHEAVRRLPARIGTLDIITAQLPTSYAHCGAALTGEIERVGPAIVLCVGEANERTKLNIERVALNVQDARIADNDGAQPMGLHVIDEGPAAYFATLPVRAIHAALSAADLPAEISNSAGTFVCNHLFYTLMHHAATSGAAMHCGFLHVPGWRDDNDTAMPIAGIVRGIVIALEVTALEITANAVISDRPRA
jgi:pyroglutamyl-peptidase